MEKRRIAKKREGRKEGIIVPILEREEKVRDYRDIILMSSIYKIYAAKKLKRRKWRKKEYYQMTRQDSEEE